MPADRYELVIIVNGCCEPYLGQIKDHLATFPTKLHTTVVQTDRGGVSNARNMGLDLAKGRYVSFVDDDDWVSPDYLEGLLSVVDGDAAMAIANVMNLDERTGQMRDDWLSASYKKKQPGLQWRIADVVPQFPVCRLLQTYRPRSHWRLSF